MLATISSRVGGVGRFVTTLHYDSTHDDDTRRANLYRGDVYVFSPRKSTLALSDFARELIEAAFAPLDPRTAQRELTVERFVEIAGPLKPRFIHHPHTLELERALLVDLGCDTDQLYLDVPRMRVATSDHYLDAGVAYPLHPHRDTWYSSPMCQLNWWLPVYPIESTSTFAFHPRYWDRAVANSSSEYDHYEWNRSGRKDAAKEIKVDTRKQPRATGVLELEPQVRLVVPPGGLMLFSGAQLHSTVPNTSGLTRWSIDFRTAHLAELAVAGGAPNLDSAGHGTTLRELRRLSDLATVPLEVLRRHEPVPPADESDLVFKPPADVRRSAAT
jgi:hypothetical protein